MGSMWIKDQDRVNVLKAKMRTAIEESGCVYSEVSIALADIQKEYQKKGWIALNSLDFGKIATQDISCSVLRPEA